MEFRLSSEQKENLAALGCLEAERFEELVELLVRAKGIELEADVLSKAAQYHLNEQLVVVEKQSLVIIVYL